MNYARTPILGYTMDTVHVEGTIIGHWFCRLKLNRKLVRMDMMPGQKVHMISSGSGWRSSIPVIFCQKESAHRVLHGLWKRAITKPFALQDLLNRHNRISYIPEQKYRRLCSPSRLWQVVWKYASPVDSGRYGLGVWSVDQFISDKVPAILNTYHLIERSGDRCWRKSKNFGILHQASFVYQT